MGTQPDRTAIKYSPMQVRIDRVNGTDLDVVNAARRSFGSKSEWAGVHSEWVDGSVRVETPFLSDADKSLLTFLGRGFSTDNFQRLVDQIAAAGWSLHEEAHNNDYDEAVYGDKLRHLVSCMWKWRDEAIHDTPFNHVGAHFSVMMPIFVARQLVKTEYMPWSEISRRYKEEGFTYWKPGLSDGIVWRQAPSDKKQGSGGPLPPEVQIAMDMSIDSNTIAAHNRLLYMLDSDVCLEQARMILPANLMVEVTWSGFLGAICKMLRERTGSHAQEETKWIAKRMLDLLQPHFPCSISSLVVR